MGKYHTHIQCVHTDKIQFYEIQTSNPASSVAYIHYAINNPKIVKRTFVVCQNAGKIIIENEKETNEN